MWLSLLLEAEQGIDVLAFSGTFFAQSNPRIATMPAQLAASGVKVRPCFGDPHGRAVAVRGPDPAGVLPPDPAPRRGRQDPTTPEGYGWRFLRAAYSPHHGPARETAQHVLMREAVVESSGPAARMRAAQDALRDSAGRP